MSKSDSSSGPPPGAQYCSVEDAEKILLQRLEESAASPGAALRKLAEFYAVTGKLDESVRRYRQLLQLHADPEMKAACVLAMGAAAERANDFLSAVRYYREALAFEPVAPEAWYFIHNNLGFSLNQLGRFSEGEFYCRTAIGILPERPNAHKNLGLAHAGQGRWREAALCFIEATRVRPQDPRSCAHLEDLLKAHPELHPEFAQPALECRAAVTAATAWKN